MKALSESPLQESLSQFIDAARTLGTRVLRAEVSFYNTGGITVRIQVPTEADVYDLGHRLGCDTPVSKRSDNREWLCAERGRAWDVLTATDALTVTVTGGHHAVDENDGEQASLTKDLSAQRPASAGGPS